MARQHWTSNPKWITVNTIATGVAALITIGLTVLNTEIVSRSLFGPKLIVSQGPQGKIGGSWLMVENVGFGMATNIELEFMDMLSREIDTIMPASRTTVTGSVEGTRTVLIPRIEPDGSVVIFFAELRDPKPRCTAS